MLLPENYKPAGALSAPASDLLSQDDAMGTATISYRELVAALQSGVVYHVPLAEQTHNQVLFLDVSVTGVP